MYYNERYNKCQDCDIGCIECDSSTINGCLKCSDRRHYLQDGICVSSCTDGYYLETGLNDNRRCIKCNSNCHTCLNNSNYCLKCKHGFKLTEKNECKEYILRGKQF